MNVNIIEYRSAPRFSPDGTWIALAKSTTFDRAEDQASDSWAFSNTGVGFGEGDAFQRRIRLIHVRTGKTVELSTDRSSSWGASWSPDGKQLAYYSDSGGVAGIWIWDVASGQARQLGNHIPRTIYAFERLRWTPDGQHLLAKILPKGMTVAQANATFAPKDLKRSYGPLTNDGASGVILQSGPNRTSPAENESSSARHFFSDLAMIDVSSGAANRLVEGAHILSYHISPDSKYVGYTVHTGYVPVSQSSLYDLRLHDLATGANRTIGQEIKLEYGNEFRWSPNSDRIAFISQDERGRRKVMVRLLDGSASDAGELGDGSFNIPLWDERGGAIYALGDGKLWRLSLATKETSQMGNFPNLNLTGLVARDDTNQAWTENGKLWLFAQQRETAENHLVSIDLATGQSRIRFKAGEHHMQRTEGLSSDVSRDGLIAYFGNDPRRGLDIWSFDSRTGKRRQLSRLNEAIERAYEASGWTSKRLISWKGADGQKLEGVLSLPPDYKPGKKLPTLVWVYAGSEVARTSLKKAGFFEDMPLFNFDLLTTRGYAVFEPNIPVRPGELVENIYSAVMPGVEAIIEQGYADPDRLGVGGHSFGSYTTWALLVKTNIFKAAVTSAGSLHPDLYAAYLNVASHSFEDAGMGYIERGQVQMDGDPWTYPERYLKNSLVFDLDKISTPLLMGQGADDGDLRASDSMFSALRRLNKDVEYRIYQHENHVPSSKAVVRDFWKRRLEFFRKHLGSEGVAAE